MIRLRRQGRSSARTLDRSFTTCRNCRGGSCSTCVDVWRSTYSAERLCTCGRSEHDAALPANPPTGRLARPNQKEPT